MLVFQGLFTTSGWMLPAKHQRNSCFIKKWDIYRQLSNSFPSTYAGRLAFKYPSPYGHWPSTSLPVCLSCVLDLSTQKCSGHSFFFRFQWDSFFFLKSSSIQDMWQTLSTQLSISLGYTDPHYSSNYGDWHHSQRLANGSQAWPGSQSHWSVTTS